MGDEAEQTGKDSSAPDESAARQDEPVLHDTPSAPATPETDKTVAPLSPDDDAKVVRRRSARRWVVLSSLMLAALASASLYLWHDPGALGGLRREAEKAKAVITGKPTPTPDPYAEALAKVEADRGEAEGRQAQVEIPTELKQYKEPHRFLAIQAASAREAGIRPPRDFVELAGLIARGGELVEVPRLGPGYVIYGVGLAANGELTHYDAKSEQSVPLFANDDELKAYDDGLATQRAQLESDLKDLNDKLKGVARKERDVRAGLMSEVASKRKELGGLNDKAKLVESFYAKADGRHTLFAEYETLASLARNFGGRSYDLSDTASAKEFQTRMLTFVRPPALALIEELGREYEAKFGRPLAITSLVRTEEYQRLLRESGNANAVDVGLEPHTTGLAFDVFYKFMSGAEQDFVMGELARLEREGRVEALRELRDHYHVFVFPEGRAPDEKEVEKEMKGGAKESAQNQKPEPQRGRSRRMK